MNVCLALMLLLQSKACRCGKLLAKPEKVGIVDWIAGLQGNCRVHAGDDVDGLAVCPERSKTAIVT